MPPEKFEQETQIDELEKRESVDVDMAAREIRDFLFNPIGGNPFGADRFTAEQLKEKFFAQSKKDIVIPLTPGDFPGALRYMCDAGWLGFDAETDTYYNKDSA